jgi:AcrR family transcriptional regulator
MAKAPVTAKDKPGDPLAPRSAKGRRTRARLVMAAKEIFTEDGFLDARISDIVERAGLSHGSFYHYFDSKEQIFREVAELQEIALFHHRSAAEDASQKASPIERIRRANRSYLEWYRDEARWMRVVEQMSRVDAEVNAVRVVHQHGYVARTQQAIERLQQEGLVDPAVDPAFAGDALGAMVSRIAELWLVQGWEMYEIEHVVDQLTLLWVNAIGLRTPKLTTRGARSHHPA